ncbi:hypothetical protein PG999_007069 [Apiospora kogelbergensis]|uniref:Uncharacterized protein n=1 Tax=Apiospora kogelbergensis TaxID=1337665 RepID=A0AAW0QXA2_9PEZI
MDSSRPPAVSVVDNSRSLVLRKILPALSAPALPAIKYEIQHFDLPPVPEGPFIGKGDEVDKIPRHHDIPRRNDQNGHGPRRRARDHQPGDGGEGLPGGRRGVPPAALPEPDAAGQPQGALRPLGGDTAAPKHDLHNHIDHCVDALRQFVMCQADVNVFAFRFPFNDGDPWPDYTTPHVCRNYENIRQWAVDHGVPQVPGEPDH